MGLRKGRTRGRHRNPKKSVGWWIGLGFGVLAIGVLGWLGVRGLIAKNSLEQAIPLTQEIKANLLANEPEKALARVGELSGLTSTAAALTSDPVWRLFELVPGLGANLAVVREAADIVNEVTVDGIVPVAALAEDLDISSFKPVDGRIDVQPIIDAQDEVAQVDDVVRDQLERASLVDTQGVLPPVRAAMDQLVGVLSETSAILGPLRDAVELMPGFLGADGPRNYLLIFQNNAEARALGGNPASLALVTVDAGKIDLAQQASSSDFMRGVAVDIGLPPELFDLYAPNMNAYVQDFTKIPDFPTTARLAQALWLRDIGTEIDGVVSFDPVALSYLLAATGPITLSTGDELRADNVVSLLLSEVYFRYPGDTPEQTVQQNAFFNEAARATFDLVKSGAGDTKALIQQLMRSVDEGRMMLWSARDFEQELIGETPLSGTLPLTNDDRTTVGVFFNDFSEAKLSYYLDTSVEVSSPECTATGGLVTVSTVTVTSRVPEDYSSLPRYVKNSWGTGTMLLDLLSIGPVGGVLTSEDSAAIGGQLVRSAVDNDRPVVRISFQLDPGQTRTFTVTMTTPPGEFGPLELRTTPLVGPTPRTLGEINCP